MKYKNNEKSVKAGNPVLTVITILVALALVGVLIYMMVSGGEGGHAVSSSSSSLPLSLPVSSVVSEPVSVAPVVTPASVRTEAESISTDSPYFEGSLPVLVNNTHKIADGLIDSMREANQFVQPNGSGTYWIHESVNDALKDMIAAAANDGITLSIGQWGGLRITERQKSVIYDPYVAQGLTDDQIRALNGMPDYCENQLGMAVDFSPADASFANTEAYLWLKEHCTEYGFILRFPQEKESVTGVTFQPYHFRYVGINHATAMKNADYCLEEYLQ